MTYTQGESSETSSVNSRLSDHEDTPSFAINAASQIEVVEEMVKALKTEEKDLVPETRDISQKDEMLLDADEVLLQEKLALVDDDENFDHLRGVSEVASNEEAKGELNEE
jgi:hypothetical protein